MIITYWADIACPFCYVGVTRLQKALQELKIADKTPLAFKSFQLDPTLPTTTDLTMTEYYAKNHQLSLAAASQKLAAIDQFAADAGLTMQMANSVPVNTLAAHRLIKYAETLGDQQLVTTMINKLYELYFTTNKSIADHDTLTTIAVKLGMDQAAVNAVLSSHKFEDEVRQDERRAFMLGIPSAPLFVINNQYSITGAQPYEVFVASLKKIIAKD